MTGYMAKKHTPLKLTLNKRIHGPQCIMARCSRARLPKKLGINTSQQPGVMVGLPAQHYTVCMLKVLVALSKRLDTAVNNNFKVRIGGLQPVHPIVLQWWNITVFFR